VRRVFEVGADDIVTLPTDRQTIGFAIHKLVARRQSTSGRGRSTLGRLVVVLGPKGGTGKTLTATNLAVALQQAGERVALVDLDLQFGDVSLCMGVDPTRTFHDLALTGPVEAERVSDYLLDHTSGVKVLVAPHRPDQAAAITVEAVRDVYSALRHAFDVVVVDTPPGFTAEVIASIDMSTDLVVVGMLDALSLKNTKLGLETLDLMGYDPDDIRLLLNRAGTRVGIPPEAVAAVLGRTPDVEVPSDRDIPRTINEGVPVVIAEPDSEPAAAFRRLAAFYMSPEAAQRQEIEAAAAAAPAEGGRRLFGRKRG
jgi:pilus assembly protein CpaE